MQFQKENSINFNDFKIILKEFKNISEGLRSTLRNLLLRTHDDA